jgi:hypothetical protein
MGVAKEVNADVGNAIEIKFQKHCAIYILLENYADPEQEIFF